MMRLFWGVIDDVLIPIVIIGGVAYTAYENKELIAKYAKEIASILPRAVGPTGFQYSLRASVDGLDPNVRGGTTPLKAVEVWKYGETTQGNARYSAKDLASFGPGVYLVPELIGNQIEIKIAEKSKIFTYVLSNFVYFQEIKSSDKMECKLAQYISDEISEKARIVTNFSLEMNSYFEGKEYGSGLREIVIGIICVSLKFEEFFKIGQPIYTKSKRTRKVDIEIEIERTLEYNIKIDYETFKSANVEQTQKLLAASIMDSLDVFERVKIVDFDSEQFKMDLQNCFKVMRVA